MMKKLLVSAVAAMGMVGIAQAAPVTISNSSVLAGVSDYGTLGSDGNTAPGILYDASGTSNYGVNDFLTPGDPFEGFYVTSATGSKWGSNNDAPTSGGMASFGMVSPTSTSSTSASWTGTSTDGLQVSNNYSLGTTGGRSVISIQTVITNNTGSTISGMDFLRTLDPDPDVNTYGNYSTNNSIINGQACGTGAQTGQTICIFSSTSGGVAGISSWSTNPADFLVPGGLNVGNGDNQIGMAYSLGDLAAGGSITLNYGYALGGTLKTAVASPVPEPKTYAMLLAGLGLIGFIARKKKGQHKLSAFSMA